MTNEVKNVPELRFPNFSEEWEKFVFKDQIISIEKGTDLLGSEDNVGIPLIKMGNIKRGYFSFNKLEKLREIETIQEKYYIKKGDFLFNTRNTMELVGKSATWTNESGKFAFNSNVARLVLKGIDTYFFNYLYNTSKMINKVKSLAVGTTSVAAIYPRDLNHLNYFLPLIAEQEKIGEFFSKLDRQIELEEQKLEKLKEQKKGYMQKIFSQELRFKDKNGNEYPEWEVIKLKDILSERKEYSSKIGNYPHATLSTSGISLKSDRYNRDFLVKDKNKKYKVTIMNDICYNPANLKFGVITRNHIGSVIFSPIYITFEVNNAHSPLFIELLVTRNDFINRVRKYEEGTVYERMAVKPEDFLNYETKIPCLEEQEKIGDFFSKLDKVINKQRQKIDELKLRKQGLLQKMFV